MNNRMISEYGSYDWKKLWNNIVQFPNESFYYVSKDHIILKVIEVSTIFRIIIAIIQDIF